MSINIDATGTVDNADLQQLRITRASDGSLTATVTYQVTVLGATESRTANWTLSGAEETAITALLPSARAAIENELGLP
jgi:hypothetical protein